MEEILWHRRESRRKRRKQTSSYSRGRPMPTRKERGLAGLLSSLADQASGRPCQPVDSEKQSLERQLEQAHRECAILQHKMALKDVLTDLKLTPGMNRAEKK
jgi:hypothetical protein